ncbi:ribosomal protein S18 acetylase RimI-like enzyme [Agromyces cerinus]|uniref:GNAT family N-acetyltransferase n=1 Tax=Agromyces cerinus TaxID=33878 RepID=UPI0019571272|nr:GNAT family N-acetyltransferase [Agromyces cerinus]MBM7832660.1 ribosomal protein S18 acetylase RimI-like enzyme [Agromyces cerinus]
MTDDVRLRLKTEAETAAWLPVAMAAYEQARQRAGENAEQAAVGRRASEDQYFPDGRLIDGHLLFTVEADGEDAGWLWIGPMSEPANWYIWDVAIHETHRRRGLGSRVMQLAEEVAREQGAVNLRLNVFGYNTPAIRLYESLGYETAAIHMQKVL